MTETTASIETIETTKSAEATEVTETTEMTVMTETTGVGKSMDASGPPPPAHTQKGGDRDTWRFGARGVAGGSPRRWGWAGTQRQGTHSFPFSHLKRQESDNACVRKGGAGSWLYCWRFLIWTGR